VDSTVISSEIEVRATPESRWSQTTEPASQIIALEQGVVWTKITHNRPHPPVVFRVPDGQIEDVGTTFTVAVRDGQTQRVAVDEGTVLVHLRGLNDMRLSAGQSWERKELGAAASAPPLPQAPETTAAPSDNANPAAPVAQVEEPAASPPPATDAKARARASKTRKSTAEEARLLKKGRTALQSGRYTEALNVLDRFAASYPQSGLAEDAAYMRVLSLARSGRNDDALKAARDYLARFPNGFRRTEMQNFVEPVKH
ncbi:MAG TPA: tetratricopeptide repeat protein, partial [Polyangiaceae bacterium]